MSPTGKTYSIRSIADFLNVPLHRLPDCLEEFRTWIAMAIAARTFLNGIPAKMADEFLWVDDGEGECTLKIVTSEGEVLHTETHKIDGSNK